MRLLPRRVRILARGFVLALITFCVASPHVLAQDKVLDFEFHDQFRERGLLPSAEGLQAHGAGWGDIDGDGWLDLYIGTFHTQGKPNLLFRNDRGTFQLDQQKSVQISSRTTGVVFADLDNDGDVDMYVGSMPKRPRDEGPPKAAPHLEGCKLFRNEGNGQFTNISVGNGACPEKFGGRSVAVLDFDGDSLLDLLVGEDPLSGYNGSDTHSSRIFRNRGGLQFEDVSGRIGLPAGIPALGVAAADVNNDTWPDIFLASNDGGNRLFLNDGRGHFVEATGSRDTFKWASARGDNMICGVAFGDVDRDGLMDVVIGQHYDHPWREPVPNRLYLNQGIRDGVPDFKDVTEQVGLVPLPMKAPHVEIQDFDNDGWPDISTSMVKFAGEQPVPVIFHNKGVAEGLPRFSTGALDVNDFPTGEDRSIKRTGKFYEKMLNDGKVIYTAAGPSGDFDNDGRLDLFLANWWPASPSLLLRNETTGGNWLDVTVSGGGRVNAEGIGSRINIYPAGKQGSPHDLLGSREISVGFGYASGQAPIAHFGLGDADKVDVEVILPHGVGKISRTGVAVGQRITIDIRD